MRVQADGEVCVGAGMCALTAPAVFTQDDEDGRVVLRQAVPDRGQEAATREAADLCPSGAITVREDCEAPR